MSSKKVKYPVCILFTNVLKSGWVQKAWKSEPDGVILDLEDSIPVGLKSEARVAAADVSKEPGLNWVLRINSHSSGLWKEDLSEALTENTAIVLLPKAESSEEVRDVELFMGKVFERKGIKADVPFIIPTIETAKGLSKVEDIALSSSYIMTLSFGIADFIRDLRFISEPSEMALTYARFRISVACRAANLLPPHDSPYLTLDDPSGLRKEANAAKELAYGGKHAIHPSQVPIIKDAFNIDEKQLKGAKRIVEEFEKAIKTGVAAIKVDGKMVDYPVYHKAQQLLNYSKELVVD